MEKQSSWLESVFHTGSATSVAAFHDALDEARTVVSRHFAAGCKAYGGMGPHDLTGVLASGELLPDEGIGLREVLAEIGEKVVRNSVRVTDPLCAAHLHCPPLIPALAAEVLISAMNQSMDSWDQSPAGTLLEQRMTQLLCRIYGLPGSADGTFTSGGTQSNLLGLLLARNHFALARLGWDARKRGLPPDAGRLRILCSEHAHFSVSRSAMTLGLGEQCVVAVAADSRHRLSPEALDRRIGELRTGGLLPFAILATAGTTDYGSIDPLPEIADRAEAEGLWLHVDAAYGGALILSDRHARALRGIERANSITVDFHKLFYQPISCGAFLVGSGGSFDLIRMNAEYLNPESEELAGVPNLVGKSLQTTRRFDALKLHASFQCLGRRGFAEMIDRTLELAGEAASRIGGDPRFELLNPDPQLNAIVFRFLPPGSGARDRTDELSDRVNRRIRDELLASGAAVIGRTRAAGRQYLKLTLLNPRTTIADIERLLARILDLGNLEARANPADFEA